MKKYRWIMLLAGLILLLVLALSVFFGRYPKPFFLSITALRTDELAQKLVLLIRLPRIIFAMMLGIALSTAGLILQKIFRNPLVEPGFLGVSQGAAFGAAIGIIAFGQNVVVMEVSSAAFALAGLLLTLFLAGRFRLNDPILKLVFAGIAVSALFSAGVGLLKYMADPVNQLPQIVFWLLGSLSSIQWKDVLMVAPIVFPILLLAIVFRWRINVLSMEDQVSRSIGAHVERERFLFLLIAVILVAVVTAIAGIIGWVGLVIPQIGRRLFDDDAAKALPFSILAGAIFLLVCDDLARILLAGEIPLGIITSFFGAAVFMFLFSLGFNTKSGRKNTERA
jgi:iron complex transport system permease protein